MNDFSHCCKGLVRAKEGTKQERPTVLAAADFFFFSLIPLSLLFLRPDHVCTCVTMHPETLSVHNQHRYKHGPWMALVHSQPDIG